MKKDTRKDNHSAEPNSATTPVSVRVPTLGLFYLTNQGVIFYPSQGKRGGKILVCSHLVVIARAVDEQGRAIGWLLRWKDHKGLEQERVVLSEQLHGGGLEYQKALHGLRIQPLCAFRGIRDLLASYIENSEPSEEVWLVTRAGWQGGAYILPDGRLIGRSQNERRIFFQPPDASSPQPTASGSHQAWVDNVARYCEGNSLLMLAVSAAFAAPLLRFGSGGGFGFHLRGLSSTGKTTALQAAASVWGKGDMEGYIRPWKATTNGLESVAVARNDALLPLDELAEIDSREAGKAAYMLANGCGKIRANQHGGGREVARWRLIFISSGEVSLEEHMAEGGKQVRAGQQVRMIEIPADAGQGHGLFECLHGMSAKELADKIKNGSQTYYGTAIAEFLKKLIEDGVDPAKCHVPGHRRQSRPTYATTPWLSSIVVSG